MSSIFYNTINLSGEALKKENAIAAKQADLISEIFKANNDREFSPSQILNIVESKYDLHWPLTSIRRAMSDLSSPKLGRILEKTENMVEGIYGKSEHQWKYSISRKAIPLGELQQINLF